MRQSVRVLVLTLVVAAFLGMAPSAQALPRDWWIDTYYDCDFVEVGWHLRDCYNQHYYYGQQYGAYKESYQEECSTGNPVDYSWWYWNGSSWEPYTGQECP